MNFLKQTWFKIAVVVLSITFLSISCIPVQAKTVYVNGYYRSNGTYVQPYTRSSPSTSIKTYTPPKPTYYINTTGNKVQSPTFYNSAPAGASAKCRDNTYSFSQHRQGTCNYHGGVQSWY